MKTEAIYLKLPETLLKGIDSVMDKEGYTSRQEFIREAVRSALVKYRIQLFHETVEKLKKKAKLRRTSPILTRREKDEIARDYLKEKGFSSDYLR
jgi:Arc/MetJ-type ribon-helix-helix transcriptional regulator